MDREDLLGVSFNLDEHGPNGKRLIITIYRNDINQDFRCRIGSTALKISYELGLRSNSNIEIFEDYPGYQLFEISQRKRPSDIGVHNVTRLTLPPFGIIKKSIIAALDFYPSDHIFFNVFAGFKNYPASSMKYDLAISKEEILDVVDEVLERSNWDDITDFEIVTGLKKAITGKRVGNFVGVKYYIVNRALTNILQVDSEPLSIYLRGNLSYRNGHGELISIYVDPIRTINEHLTGFYFTICSTGGHFSNRRYSIYCSYYDGNSPDYDRYSYYNQEYS